MLSFNDITNEFKKYNLLLYDINGLNKQKPSDFNIDVTFSNNFAYPQFTLGFSHYIHQIKEGTKELNKFNTRKKVYLVTSLFEKSIDYKNIKKNDDNEQVDENTKSINDSLSEFIKSVDKNYPSVLNRAFLKFWEMIILFDLIPDDSSFTSSHLAEGPGSFIQATILYREFLKKNKQITSTKDDNYYGVTLFSDHDYLQMQRDYINYINKTKPNQLHIFDNTNVNKIDQMFGGDQTNKNKDENENENVNYKELFKSQSNGDITKLNTILQFGGSKSVDSKTKGFSSKPSNLVTADGGFDWNNENLQEQEAYKLIIGQIVTALKVQKNGGDFVIKIFESYTLVTIKLIEFLRSLYENTYIYKPYTSRISNSEKYIVCKNFNKKLFTTDISSKLDLFVKNINDNDIYDISDIFTNIVISEEKIKLYKNINISFLVKQYIGINNILQFIHLDNYNGIEYNTYLKKQIIASYFWTSLFLNPSMFNKLFKFSKNYNYLQYEFISNDIFINNYKTIKNIEEKNIPVEPNEIEDNTKTNKSSIKRQTNKLSSDKKIPKKTIKKTSKSKIQKGGANQITEEINLDIYNNNENTEILSDDVVIGTLNS
jgi:23S rRNA U2552 (ribose-2'-O)-methylase RlmE/FtsJ